LPENVLKNNAGNCIDLTVLFASILEGVGLHSLIFLTKDHAFIGWGDKDRADQIVCLEATAIGRCTFEEAVALGQQVFEENFTFKGVPQMLPPFLVAETRGCHIIDTAEVRSSGRALRDAR